MLLTDAGNGKYFVADSNPDLESSFFDSIVSEYPYMLISDDFDLSLIIDRPVTMEYHEGDLFRVEDDTYGTLYLYIRALYSQSNYWLETYVMYDGVLHSAIFNGCDSPLINLDDYADKELLDTSDYEMSHENYWLGDTKNVTFYKAKETFVSKGEYANGDTFTKDKIYIAEKKNGYYSASYATKYYINLPYSSQNGHFTIWDEDIDKFETFEVQWPSDSCITQ